MRAAALLVVSACAGAAQPDEGVRAPGPTPGDGLPVEASAEPGEAPEQTLEEAQAKESAEACTRACARIASCASAEAAEGCSEDCESSLAQGRGSPALRFAACLDETSCKISSARSAGASARRATAT
jgi:hypothetical protein